MSPITPGERTEDLIKSALRFGKKREIELVNIVDKAEPTVRNHLKELENEGEVSVENESGHKYYYLPDGAKEPIEPRPSASDERVRITLDIIESHFADESRSTSDIEDWEPPEIRDDLYDTPDDVTDAIIYFGRISSQKYHVISDNDNLNKLLFIIDELVGMFDDENSTQSLSSTVLSPISSTSDTDDQLQLPEEFYSSFFLAVTSVHRNWLDGKEHEKLREKLLARTDRVIENSARMPDRFADGLQHLVFAVNQQKGEEMFQRMFRSKEFDMDTLEDICDRTYIYTNSLNKLFNLFDSLKREEPGKYDDEIDELKTRIKDKF